MLKSELNFEFPENLIAKEPLRPSRICSQLGAGSEPEELSWPELFKQFQKNDLLILNNTKVLKRRLFTEEGLEILFLNTEDRKTWQVLFPSRKYKVGQQLKLPGGRWMTLLEKGRPQKIQTHEPLLESYFQEFGELPLPPYIQKVREQRHTQDQDSHWYQTVWAEKPGSFAAPTASLHFDQSHLDILKAQGVNISYLTLHVGLGTFLPVEVEDLKTHSMHFEEVEIPLSTIESIERCHASGGKVWAMGTTVVRALESQRLGKLDFFEGYYGKTDLLILPGFTFKVVDRLLTNFHQPESTLLALVMAFAGTEKVRATYEWAIRNQFRLFSYGDLSVWKCTPSVNQ